MTTYLLLPSVLVGAVTWTPVAEQLRQPADTVLVADPAGSSTPQQVLDAYVAAAPNPRVPSTDADLVVVPHSNAGLYAPAVAERTGARAVVYVDAALPPARGQAALAPPELLTTLAGLADDDGMLPPWTRWWDDIAGLFPDERTRADVEAFEPRLPMAYFHGTLAVPAGWEATPSAYLAFGDTYAEEQGRAAASGWPLRRLDGNHLHLLHDPHSCATVIRELATELSD